MQTLKEIIGYITGPGTIGLFIACLIFAYAAAFVMIALDVKFRDKLSPNTPDRFSTKFFYLDNLLRIWGNAALIYFAVRLLRGRMATTVYDIESGDLIDQNSESQLLFSAIIGIVSDQLFFWAKKFKLYTSKKVRDRFKSAGLSDEELDKP